MNKEINKNQSNEAESPAFLVADVIGIACSRHKPKLLGHLQWFDWVDKKKKRGAMQKQCPKCGRWYFREEF
jgi:hypothetical protein